MYTRLDLNKDQVLSPLGRRDDAEINIENINRAQNIALARDLIAKIRTGSAEEVYHEAEAFLRRICVDPRLMNRFSFVALSDAPALRAHPMAPEVMLACSARMRELAEAEQAEPWSMARVLLAAAAVWAAFITMIWFLV